MLNSTFGLNKDFLKFIDKENSYQVEDSYILIFITGEKQEFKKVGIKKAVMNYIDLHREALEVALNQAERIQPTNTEAEAEENESKQDESNQANSTEIAVFNNIQ